MKSRELFVGSYTSSMGGNGNGITVFAVDDSGEIREELSHVAVDSPSFLALAPGRLFAVHEGEFGGVSSFARVGAQLTRLATMPSGGIDPCHVLAVGDGRGGIADRIGRAGRRDGDNAGRAHQLLVANYGSGSVAALVLHEDGSLGRPRVTELPSGAGPDCARQAAPHAHQVVASDRGVQQWLVSDLGGDRVLEYSLVGDTAPALIVACALPEGAGPRHMVWVDDALLVVGELDSRLHVLRRDDNSNRSNNNRSASGDGAGLRHAGSTCTLDPGGAIGTPISFPSHLMASVDGRFAYTANRGRDTMSVFDVAAVVAGRLPELVQEITCGGKNPRHFTLEGNYLYIANQSSDSIDVFELDLSTGLIGGQVQSVQTGSPACLVFS